jgi:hypothetical protein
MRKNGGREQRKKKTMSMLHSTPRKRGVEKKLGGMRWHQWVWAWKWVQELHDHDDDSSGTWFAGMEIEHQMKKKTDMMRREMWKKMQDIQGDGWENDKEKRERDSLAGVECPFLKFVVSSVLRRCQRLLLQLCDLHVNMEERPALKLWQRIFLLVLRVHKMHHLLYRF